MRFFSFVFAFLLITFSASGENNYQEVYGPNGLRSAYQHFNDKSRIDITKPTQQQIEALTSGHPLKDKNTIFPIPLILEESEFDLHIMPGVHQRLKAILAFFEDLVLGKQEALGPDGFITQEAAEKIFRDEKWAINALRDLWKGKDTSYLSALYGPDLIRNPNGAWSILEDNFGNLGGNGEVSVIRDAWAHTMGIKPLFNNLEDDIISGVRFFLNSHDIPPSKAVAFISGVEALDKLSGIEKLGVDLEYARRAKRIKRMGIEILDPANLKPADWKKLESGHYKAVLNFHDCGRWHDDFRLWNSVFKKHGVRLLQPPGVTSLGNKALLPYVEKMIEFYLNEKPILKTQPTSVMWDYQWPRDGGQWVIKRAGGAQGSEVFLANRLSKVEKDNLKKYFSELKTYGTASGSPMPLWVKQELGVPSVLSTQGADLWQGYLLDIRPITYAATSQKIRVGFLPWGRATPNVGEGKINVSRGAYEMVVLKLCAKLLAM